MQIGQDITLDGEKFALAELLNVGEIEPLLTSFCEAVGVASAIIDLEGRVLIAANWQPLCTEFHRVTERSRRRCIESDTQLALELRKGEKFARYRCKNGLVDCASPIVVGGQHLANLFIGQFLLAPPDRDFFRTRALELGFESESYLAALERVPVIPEEKLSSILRYLCELAKTIATISRERLVSRRRVQGVQRVLKMLAGPWAQLTGREFHLAVCRYISEELTLEYVFVGELTANGRAVRVLAGWGGGAEMPAMVYDLWETPCADVMTQGICVFRERIRELFPRDRLLSEMGVESYAGVVLRDKRQQPMGIMVAMGAAPLAADHPVNTLLPVFVEQVSAEIQRGRAQEALRAQSEELQRRNEELSRLNVVMAHHFQEPSRRLVTFASQLRGQGGAVAAGKNRRVLEFIEQQSIYLNRLVRDIQRYLGIGADYSLAKVLDSRLVLERVLGRMAAAIKEAKAEVLLPDPLPPVRFYEEYLEMIFTILIDNALTYRRTDRPLRLEIRAGMAGDRARFRCRDNGRGVAEEYRRQVFELFSRLGGNSADLPGTGVGLAIVRKAVGVTGGSVTIEDGIEGGVEVAFDLPAAGGGID